MNFQQTDAQFARSYCSTGSIWFKIETIYCIQRGDNTNPDVTVFDTADARDGAGGQSGPELWFDVDVPLDCSQERKAAIARECAVSGVYLRNRKCRVVFRNAASIAAISQPGFKFAPGDVVVGTNDYGVKWHARRIVAQEMSERGPTYYLTPTDAPWYAVPEEGLEYALQSYDELLELLPHDGGLMRRVEKEPRYLERVAETIAAQRAAHGLDNLASYR